MSAKIESILDAKMYVVRTNDDREGEQLHLVAYMPHTGRSLVVQSAKVLELRSGGGPFKGLSAELERDFVARITGAPKEPAKKPTPRKKSPAAEADGG